MGFTAYYRSLYSVIVAYGISLYSTSGPPHLDQMYLSLLITNDNTHYIFLATILMSAFPITVPILVLGTYSLYQCATFTSANVHSTLLGPTYKKYLEARVQKLLSHQHQVLIYCAQAEIVTLFYVIIETFLGRGSLVLVIGYYWFLNFRYLASSNSKMVLEAFGAKLDGIFASPSIPFFIRTPYNYLRNRLRNSVQPPTQ